MSSATTTTGGWIVLLNKSFTLLCEAVLGWLRSWAESNSTVYSVLSMRNICPPISYSSSRHRQVLASIVSTVIYIVHPRLLPLAWQSYNKVLQIWIINVNMQITLYIVNYDLHCICVQVTQIVYTMCTVSTSMYPRVTYPALGRKMSSHSHMQCCIQQPLSFRRARAPTHHSKSLIWRTCHRLLTR